MSPCYLCGAEGETHAATSVYWLCNDATACLKRAPQVVEIKPQVSPYHAALIPPQPTERQPGDEGLAGV